MEPGYSWKNYIEGNEQWTRVICYWMNVFTSCSIKRLWAKKYYKDQYKKTGIIPGPLLLAEKGIMEGRRCSGRPRSFDEQTKKRFMEMVKASK